MAHRTGTGAYMDYFYVGTGSPAGGLKNPYLKFKYTGNTLAAGVDFHLFSIDKDMKKADGTFIDKKLGNELDFTGELQYEQVHQY